MLGGAGRVWVRRQGDATGFSRLNGVEWMGGLAGAPVVPAGAADLLVVGAAAAAARDAPPAIAEIPDVGAGTLGTEGMRAALVAS